MKTDSFNRSPNKDLLTIAIVGRYLLTIDEQLNHMAWALDLGFEISPRITVDGDLTDHMGSSTHNYRLTHPVNKSELHYKFVIANHEEEKFLQRVKQLCRK